MSDPAITSLADLNRFRSAPQLSSHERKDLKNELIAEMHHFLISGHQAESQQLGPQSGPTWGPLPLDFFHD